MKILKLKNFLSLLFLFCLLATTLSSCKSTGVVPPTTIKTTSAVTTKEVLHDTVFQTEKDSSYYKAYLECVNGKVVVKQDTKSIQKSGKFLKPPNVSLKDNLLIIDCEAEAQKKYAQWKDTYTSAVLQTITEHPYVIEKPLSWWQKTEIILGQIFLGLILIFTALGVMRYLKYI